MIVVPCVLLVLMRYVFDAQPRTFQRVGTATLGNFIGGGGLGDVIASGINISDRIVFVGAVMVAALALLADWGLSLVEQAVVPRRING